MKTIVSLVTLLCLIGSTAYAQLYTFTRYGHSQGLEMSAVEGVTQTPDGMIWMGTDGAELYSFNGDQFQAFQRDSTSLFHHATGLRTFDNNIQFASKYLGYFEVNPKKGTNRIVKQSKEIGGEPQHFVRTNSLSLFASRCTILVEHKDGTSVKKSFVDCDLEVTQIIEINELLLILTNKGDFLTNGTGFVDLDKWVTVEKIENQYDFGYYDQSKLLLFDRSGKNQLEIVLNDQGEFYSVNEIDKQQQIHDSERFIAFHFNSFSQTGAAITDQGAVYSINGQSSSFQYIITNQEESIFRPTSIFVDRNGSIWVGTSGSGVYKLSKEVFTKIQILEEYTDQNIGFVYRTEHGVVILSYFGGESLVISPSDGYQKKQYNFTIYASALVGNTLWLATNKGLKKANARSGEISDVAFPNERLTLVYESLGKLFVAISGTGVQSASLNDGEIGTFSDVLSSKTYHFYCAENSNKDCIIFGTNDGLFKLQKGSKTMRRIPLDYTKNGGYCGVSTKDIYGNCWFTLDRALVRLNAKNKIELFSASQLFKTNLLYTLQADEYGNLFLGTNKGIFRIKLSKYGSIEGIDQFNSKNGFTGHETNMRAQFKSSEGLFVATIDGLYKISADLFENLPIPSKPIITAVQNENESIQQFNFSVNNAINAPIKYIYRIKDLNEDWRNTDSLNSLVLRDLSSGNYTLEVKASYDGINFSESSKISFEVSRPIWRSNWFILFAIGILVALNVVLIRYNRAFSASRLLESKDSHIYHKLTPGILLFGLLAISSSQFAALFLEPELKLSFGPPMLITVTMLCLLLMALSAKANGRDKETYPRLLLLGLVSAQLYFFFELFQSKIHPFHLLGVVLTSMIAPYVLQNLKQTIIYALIILAFSLGLTLLIDNVIYNKSYFLIAVFVLACLIVFIGYLHHHSQERLLFISAIINKGNLPAIAFDSEGTIQYVSENISHYADISHQQLLKKNISYLNNYVPFEDKYKDTDVLKDFKEGELYLVPMRNKEKQVRWIEWSYKNFTEELRVIIGQDVTEKMDLESTYELLVQSAEDFIYRCNVDGEFTFLNNVSFEKLGYTKEEMLGMSSLEIIDVSYRDEISKYYQDHFAQRKTTSYREFPIRSKEGALIWIGQHVTTLFAPGSDYFIKGFIALARDITDLRMQQDLIVEQRDSITSSIEYAKRIQNNLLPHQRMFSNIFSDHFVLYKAKDIVSGDFYWMDDIDDYLIFALADCTGHGVPGAFMTLLGMNLLNMIILEDKIFEPGKILDRLDERLLEILPRGEHASQVNDGMEITMCSLNKQTGELAYACAGSRFLVYKNQEFTMFKGDNKHIGDIHYEGFTHYETNFIQFAFGDEIILFTDGFQDQFGGPSDKKYSFRRFLEVFDEVIDLPLEEQKIALKHEFNQWIGNGEQTDDLTVIALKR